MVEIIPEGLKATALVVLVSLLSCLYFACKGLYLSFGQRIGRVGGIPVLAQTS